MSGGDVDQVFSGDEYLEITGTHGRLEAPAGATSREQPIMRFHHHDSRSVDPPQIALKQIRFEALDVDFDNELLALVNSRERVFDRDRWELAMIGPHRLHRPAITR